MMIRKGKLISHNSFERLTQKLNFLFIQAWEQAIEQETRIN
jgi:hypothetical protein